MHRTEKLLRDTISMLCNFVWSGRTRCGEHMWSIPVDKERDFDVILSDAISELIARRKANERRRHKPTEVGRAGIVWFASM